MTEKSIEIKMAEDFDARPIAMLVQIASRYESSVHLVAEGKKINAKSIMGMMSLSVCGGDEIVVVTDGADEEAAANEIESYLNKQ